MEHILTPEEEEEKKRLARFLENCFREGPDYDFYLIPAETPLFSGYRGKLDDYNFETAISQPKFFGFNTKTAEVYGYAFAYKTTQDYELIAMDSKKTLNYLHRIADKNIKKILKRNFGYKKLDNYTQIRTSTKSTDFKLVQYLCTQGFSGYATNFMEEDVATFHPECAICTPIGVELNPDYYYNGKLGLATPDSYAIQEKVKALILKDKQLENTEANTGKKKRESIFGLNGEIDSPPRKGSESSFIRGSLFGSPPRTGLESPLRRGSLFGSPPRTGLESPPRNGLESPPRTGSDSPDNKSRKKSKYEGGKTRKQNPNASKKGIKTLRNKSYNNVRRRKVSNRRN